MNAASRNRPDTPPKGMIRLMREIRFSIDRDWVRAAHGTDGFEAAHPVSNSWGGWPSAVGVAPFLVLRILVSGSPDPVTGYLVNIQELDAMLRQHAIPIAARRLSVEGVRLTGESLLRAILDAVVPVVPPACHLEALRLWTTPYLHYTVHPGDDSMVELTQMFEFSASHRLHVASLSDEENAAFFGKCNNPNGHGHNYRVEVTIAGEIDPRTGRVAAIPPFEAMVKREVIDRLDHTHLNSDTPEFKELNPSVENIAKVIWRMLDGKVAPAELRMVKVWETAKTYAAYSGD